jgi:hypothetical protein
VLATPARLLSGFLTAGALAQTPPTPPTPIGAQMVASAPVGPRVIELARAPGELPLAVVVGEKLTFDVYIDVAVGHIDVGDVVLEAGVDPYLPPLPTLQGPSGEVPPVVDGADRTKLPGAAGAEGAAASEPREVPWLRCTADGGYLFYHTTTTIESRRLPEEFPSAVYRYTQTGSEERRHELALGLRGDEWISSYRRDTSKGAPKGSRIWKAAVERAIPEGTLDMLAAVGIARELVRTSAEQQVFPMLDKTRLWQVTVRRGSPRIVETEAGRFDCVKVELSTAFHPDEPPLDPEKQQFAGLFGIHGTIDIYLEKVSGTPVLITGTIPAGPLDLDVDVSLAKSKHTRPGFRALPDED